MIRKAIIVFLTMAAVASGTLWLISQVAPLTWPRSRFVECAHCEGTDVEYDWVVSRGVLAAGFPQENSAGPLFPWTLDLRIPRATEMSYRSVMHEGRWTSIGTVFISLWMPVVLLAAYPTFAFIRGPLRRHRRRRKGLCLKCGYDLTGNESGTCPECGSKT